MLAWMSSKSENCTNPNEGSKVPTRNSWKKVVTREKYVCKEKINWESCDLELYASLKPKKSKNLNPLMSDIH